MSKSNNNSSNKIERYCKYHIFISSFGFDDTTKEIIKMAYCVRCGYERKISDSNVAKIRIRRS